MRRNGVLRGSFVQKSNIGRNGEWHNVYIDVCLFVCLFVFLVSKFLPCFIKSSLHSLTLLLVCVLSNEVN